MTGETDLDVNRSIRRVLVKHWIDLGRVSIRTANGRVLIRGHLHRIAGVSEESLTSPVVQAMFYEIRRLRGVGHVTTHFDNWINEGGSWRSFERQTADRDEQLGDAGGSFSVS